MLKICVKIKIDVELTSIFSVGIESVGLQN